MVRLNEAAKAVLRDAGVSQAAWARANWMADGKWCGDACGCPDSGRCMNGFHHMPDDECGCLRTLLADYLKGEGTFAEFPADTVAAAALEQPGPGVRCHGCGALPDEQHDENCPERDPGPVWPGGGE